MFSRKFWSFVIASALFLGGLWFLLIGVGDGGLHRRAFHVGAFTSGIGIVWLLGDFVFPLLKRR